LSTWVKRITGLKIKALVETQVGSRE